jgi:hypothetical protein
VGKDGIGMSEYSAEMYTTLVTVEMGCFEEQIVLDVRLQLSMELPCLDSSDIASFRKNIHILLTPRSRVLLEKLTSL